MLNEFKRSMVPVGDVTPENWLEYCARSHESKRGN